MKVSGFFSAESRLRHLEQLWLPVLFVAALLALGLYTASHATYNYGDPRYVVDMFGGLLGVAGYLLLITLLFFPADRMGLRLPRSINWQQFAPMLLVLSVVFASWVAMRLSLPADSTMDNSLSLGILRSTLVVGLNEEWIFRGLLMAAFCRRFGLRNGALIALVLFGLAHAGNALASDTPALSLLQVLSTMMTGSLLVLMALATRSLLPAMVAHALYDFMVVDMGLMGNAGANSLFMLPLLFTGVVVGIYGIHQVFHLQGKEPFVD